ncbi:MAG: 4-(cytidine 5'-diphospho)-2-C-methyl-D-erythritol kinase [Nitratireductor sp.]
MFVSAPAKINLALHVTGQRNDGFHLLESLVCFCECGDKISIKRALATTDITLKIDGPFGAGLTSAPDNLVIKASKLFLSKAGVKSGLDISLEKNLPIASGIGGGSADAAATLLALAKMFDANGDINLHELATSLGSDVAMCLVSRPLIAKGVGDEITLVDDFKPLHLLLINPNIPVSTPHIFKHLTNKNNSALAPLNETIQNTKWIEWLKAQRNDLQLPAIAAEPNISLVLEAIESTKPELSRMSGSGATCFGIYKDAIECENAYKAIIANHPKWWCVATKSTSRT